MLNSYRLRPLLGCTLLLSAALAGCSKDDAPVVPDPVDPVVVPTPVAGVGAAGIAGLNWADPRDNFVDDALVLSGLAANDTYATVQAKTETIINGFQSRTNANTVRLPINPTTVLGGSWAAYTGAIDKTLDKGMKVILACWEGNSSRNGLVDDNTQFFLMWQTVVAKYGSNANVYFEVFNEPHGYTLTNLASLYADWLSRYPSVPRGRVLLDGTGYAQDIKGIGADSRFTGCLLSIHLYDFFYNNPTNTAASWEKAFAANLGSYGSRAVLTEYGAFLTTGVDFNSAIDGDVKKSYLLGVTNFCRQQGIASVYWPGLRTGDSYSLLQFDGRNTSISNGSGLGRVQFAWGAAVAGGTDAFYPTATYRLINRNSGHVVDVNNASTTAGANIIQWYQNGDNNQQWKIQPTSGGYHKLLNRNSNLALDVNGGSTMPAANIVQSADNGGNSQQWQLTASPDGYYKLTNRGSSQVLDVNGSATAAGANIIQYTANGGPNQQWLVWQQ